MEPARQVEWPGWSAQKTLLLPIPPQRWPPPERALKIDGLAFMPKRELHVTLIGRGLGHVLHGEPGRRGSRLKSVRTAFAALDWEFHRTGVLLRLEKRELPGHGRGRTIDSIIERIEMPAMAALYDTLAELLGRTLAIPPPHVTLYIAGRALGMGIPDAATLQRLIVRELSAAELEDASDAEHRGRAAFARAWVATRATVAAAAPACRGPQLSSG